MEPSAGSAAGQGWRGRQGQLDGWASPTTPLSPPSAACVPSHFLKPPQPIILRDCQVLPLPPGLPITHSQELMPGAPPAGPQPRPPTSVDPESEPTLLRHPQVEAGPRPRGSSVPAPAARAPPLLAHRRPFPQGTVVFTTQVPSLGRYAFLLHGYQPAHPTFPVEVLIDGGRVWQGEGAVGVDR